MNRGLHQFARWISAALLCTAPLTGAQPNPSAPAPAKASSKAPIVVAIAVQPPPTWQASAFLPLVAQKTGQPLDRTAIERSIENLFSTGVFADISAVERPVAGGIELRFETRPNYFLGGVRVKGAPDPPSNTELMDVSGLQLGELYDRARQQQALTQMKQRLEAYNYRQAKITPELAFRPQQAEVVLTFLIAAGPLARVGTVSFSGGAPDTHARLMRTTKLRSGEKLSQSRLRHALRRLHQFYAKRGHLGAAIHLTTQYEGATNRLNITFQIAPGPLVSVRVAGARISRGDLKKQVPIFQEHAVDEELIDEGRDNLQNYLQKQGYYGAKVKATRTQPYPDKLQIVYQAQPGPKQQLDAVVFQGNHYFSEDDLDAQIAERPNIGWLPNIIPGVRGNFSRGLMEADAGAITALYQANGFPNVLVQPELVNHYQGHRGRLAVVFHIQEGQQWLVRRLKLEGNHAFSAGHLENLLTTAPGEPYSRLNLATDCDQILSHYYNSGYLQAQCHSQAARVAHQPRMDVAYIITEGPVSTVHQVFIGGERFVKRNVIAHEVELHPHQPLSQLAILNTQSRLYNLDLFTGVNVAVQNPHGQLPSKNVIVAVHEASRYSFSEGVGLQVQSGTGGPRIPSNLLGQTGWSPFLAFNMTRLAMTGRPQTISLKTLYSSLERRAGLDYSLPRFLNHSSLKADLTTLYDDRFDLNTFRAVRRQAAVQLSQEPSNGMRLFYRLAYRWVEALDLQVPAEEVPILSRPVNLAIAGAGMIRDHRDNPLDTHHGSYDMITFAVAHSFGASDFSRLLGEHAFYLPFGPRHSLVLANATRVGIETPFGPVETLQITNPITHLTTTTIGHIIPLPERFFSGGADSLRGFGFDQAGPRDPITGFPVGGNTMFINNLELRFPLIGPDIGGVGFYDAGNVYSTFTGMLHGLARLHEPSPTDLNYTTHTLGLGLRYKTPVGPVRVDVGYNLNPPFIQDYVTSVKKPYLQTQTLPHLQFYFSIGQTF